MQNLQDIQKQLAKINDDAFMFIIIYNFDFDFRLLFSSANVKN